MPRFAVTIGSYAMPQFLELNICALRRLFGCDLPILVSDDRSHLTPQIEAVSKRYGCAFFGSKIRRHHFCGDMQSLINSVSFAKQVGAEWAIKVSQRLILHNPNLRPHIEKYISQPNVIIALPGSPDPTRSRSPGFAKYPFLTDVIFLKASEMEANFLREYYERHWKHGTNYFASFVEGTVHDLIRGPWSGRHAVFHELTNMPPGPERLYLRRYQNAAGEYGRLAAELGLSLSGFDVSEWKALERGTYSPAPKA